MTTNVFLQAVTLDANDVWNGDGRGAEQTKALLNAIRDLPAATSSEQAHELYWRIDNVAVIQGSLYPAGPKILPALLEGLFMATPVSRPYLLEAIYQVASASLSHKDFSIHERERAQMGMIRMLEGAIRYFLHLMVRGSDEDALHAPDLMSWIVTAPERLPMKTANYESDLHVLLKALKVQHPDRYEDLSRNIFG